VYCNQQGALRLGRNRRHSLGERCNVWQRQGSAEDLSQSVSNYRSFAIVDRRLRETGTFAVNRYSTGWGRSVRTPQFYEDVLQRFEKNPFTSTCAVVHAVGVGRCIVWNVVREQEHHPFHRQKVQAVLGPTITFVETNLFVGLCTSIHRSPTFPQWCFSRMMPASPERGFSSATTAIFGQEQTLMLYLLIATTNNALWPAFERALLMTFSLGLTCYPDGSVHILTMCFWKKSYQICWRKSRC
jgi:hypothetical protein